MPSTSFEKQVGRGTGPYLVKWISVTNRRALPANSVFYFSFSVSLSLAFLFKKFLSRNDKWLTGQPWQAGTSCPRLLSGWIRLQGRRAQALLEDHRQAVTQVRRGQLNADTLGRCIWGKLFLKMWDLLQCFYILRLNYHWLTTFTY